MTNRLQGNPIQRALKPSRHPGAGRTAEAGCRSEHSRREWPEGRADGSARHPVTRMLCRHPGEGLVPAAQMLCRHPGEGRTAEAGCRSEHSRREWPEGRADGSARHPVTRMLCRHPGEGLVPAAQMLCRHPGEGRTAEAGCRSEHSRCEWPEGRADGSARHPVTSLLSNASKSKTRMSDLQAESRAST